MLAQPFDLVVLGLSLTSSWGNGHATTYRALLKALSAEGVRTLFLERRTPYYEATRDLDTPDYCDLALYDSLDDLAHFMPRIAAADAVIVGSFVPEGIEASERVLAAARGVTAFYDIDTPATLAALDAGTCSYLAKDQIPRYDLYLSFTGGPMLAHLVEALGANAAYALYCSADPDIYRPLESITPRWDLGYLGTYSADRQERLERLLIEPARKAPHLAFAVAGAQYPPSIAWPPNVTVIEHIAPCDHAAFYASQRATLNLTRADMRRWGYSPSVRLFEAAAAGTLIVSDDWPGLATILRPGREILLAETADDILAHLAAPERERRAIAAAARERVLSAHTPQHRAGLLLRMLTRGRRDAEDQRAAEAALVPEPIRRPYVTKEEVVLSRRR